MALNKLCQSPGGGRLSSYYLRQDDSLDQIIKLGNSKIKQLDKINEMEFSEKERDIAASPPPGEWSGV